jgi:hypothetical protein
MKLSEYKATFSQINGVLQKSGKLRTASVYQALQNAFPGQIPLFEEFFKVYYEGVTARELLRSLYPKKVSESPKSRRPPKADNVKHANRRDQYEVRRPGNSTPADWRKKYNDPTVIYSPPCPDLLTALEREPRLKWENEGQFLHMMKAFFRRIDEYEASIKHSVKKCNGDTTIPVPLWMATAIADGFKQYYSRRVLHKESNVTLETIFGIAGKTPWEKFDALTIDNTAIIERTREVQAYCGLAFSPALGFAARIIKAKCDLDSDGHDVFTFDHAGLESLKDSEARGRFPSLGAWLKDKGFAEKVPVMLRDSFLEYIEALDPIIRRDIETAMRDKRLLL